MPRAHSLFVIALLLVAAPPAAVGTRAQFTTAVDMVAMDVCATDRSGRPAQIDPGDLTVFDNGTRQQISVFSAGNRVPLAVTLLVDTSRSMHGGPLDEAAAAATALIEKLPDDSLVEVVGFNDRIDVLYPMGNDRRQAALSLSDVAPAGETALYEAVLHDTSDLTNIYQEIASDVTSLYRVGYVPSPLVRDGAWHQLQVRTADPDVVVRTRSGYYASLR